MILFLGTHLVLAQPQSTLKYQAVVRNSQGLVVENQQVSLRISLLADTVTGAVDYSETHLTTTNTFGLVVINIGGGTPQVGQYQELDWAKHQYFVKVEIDIEGGDNFTEMGTSPLLSVPYALHAQTVAQNNDADADPTNEIQDLVLTGNQLSITNNPAATLIDLSYLIGTDAQTLTLMGDSLAISNGNKLDLLPYKDNTDAQTLALAGSELTITGGNSIDLSTLKDADADSTNEIQDLVLTGNQLFITNNPAATLIDLSYLIGTDAQTLTLVGDSLAISNGNKLDLLPYKDNTDAQILTLAGSELTITGGNSIDLSTLKDADADSTNEIQQISIVGDTLYLSKANPVTLPQPELIWGKAGNNIFYNNGKVGIGTLVPTGTLEVKSQLTTNPDEIIFGVLNSAGDTVFAVYQGGVRVNVADNNIIKATGSRGGFAVGGISSSKGVTNEFLRVTPDSVRIYVNNTPVKATGSRGGFAVGGISSSKGSGTYMFLEPENYFIGQESGKSITTGLYNSFLGYQSGIAATEANNNVFLGYQSGFSNLTGNSNVFIGNTAGYTNTKGNSNVIIGDSAGYSPDSASYNVFIGKSSGKLNTIGEKNTFMGYNAGFNNTDGYDNVFIGNESGKNNQSGYWNVFLGSESGKDNSGIANVFLGNKTGLVNQGAANVFIGDMSGKNNLSGGSNVFIGKSSGYWNQTGSSNVFVGTYCGINNTTGNYNLFAGNASGLNNATGSSNVFLGNQCGVTNTNGFNNVFIGNEAGNGNDGGSSNVYLGDGAGKMGNTSWNVFVGYHSGYNTTDNGSHNVFLGHESGYSNTTGWSNNFIGQGAGYENTSGTNNIFIGNDAGRNNLTSSGNIYIGRNAGYFSEDYGNTIIGHSAGAALDTGMNNVFLGVNAALYKTEGTNNIIIGSYANSNGSTGNQNTILGAGAGNNASGSGNVFIGYSAGYDETTSNKLYIDNSSTTSPLIGGDFSGNLVGINRMPTTYTLEVAGTIWANGSTISAGVTTWSDARFKTNIVTLEGALANICKLRGVTYDWDKTNPDTKNFPEGKQIGVIAQELELVFPELVTINPDGYKSVAYEKLSAIFIEAMKEQQKEIEGLKQKNAQLEALTKDYENLKKEVEAIKAMIQK